MTEREAIKHAANQKLLEHLKKMLAAINHQLWAEEPDLRLIGRHLSDALQIVATMTDPRDPYTDRALRAGLNFHDAVGGDHA